MAKRNLPNMETGEVETNVTPFEGTAVAPGPTEPVNPEPVEEVKTGIVTGCSKLNLRRKPAIKAEVACVIDKGTKVVIDKKASTKEWVKVTLDNGVEGFCMKKFIQINS